jgi:hypothetical protein
MVVPLCFELHSISDWVLTDTTTTLDEWLKMDFIFSDIFKQKCSRHYKNNHPHLKGEKIQPLLKYLYGGCLLLFMMAVICVPLFVVVHDGTFNQKIFSTLWRCQTASLVFILLIQS